MKNDQFRKPLLQSAAILGGVIILTAIAASSGHGEGGGILAVLFGIGNSIMFIIGLTLGLVVCIALLFGIFLAAVAMVSTQQASQMYSDLKKNFADFVLTAANSWQCSDKCHSGETMPWEEYNRMKQEIAHLQEDTSNLNRVISELQTKNLELNTLFSDIHEENSILKVKIENLTQVVMKLDESEKDIKNLVTEITSNLQSGPDPETLSQISTLERLQIDIREQIDTIIERLNVVEKSLKTPSLSGILTYIVNEQDQLLLKNMTDEALARGLTYAQTSEYLSTSLPPELSRIIKDHPSLIKNYIRNQRKE